MRVLAPLLFGPVLLACEIPGATAPPIQAPNPAPPLPVGPTPTVRPAPPQPTASPPRSAAPQPRPAPQPTATTLAELGTRRPIPGCFCEVDRDRIEVSIPCGVTTCVDGRALACGADRQVASGDACAPSACACTVDLQDDAAVEIACGLSACTSEGTIACTDDGKVERRGPCD
jgi:hypothetical protein